MSETISNGLTLTIPSLGDQNWSASIKANCFEPISEHDHTGSGNGVQIATAAIANLAVTGGKIADGAVGEIKLADNSVTENKIFNLQVTTGKLANLAVTAAKIANTTITAAQIASDAVTTAKILDLNVTTGKLADLAVTDAKIADNTITEAKLAADAATRSTLLYDYDPLVVVDGSAVISEVTNRKIMPKAGKLTHLTAAIEQTSGGATVTGGTLKFTVYKNGTTTGKDVDLTTGEPADIGGTSTGEISFAAGDYLSIAKTQTSVTLTGGTQAFNLQIWGHFTE